MSRGMCGDIIGHGSPTECADRRRDIVIEPDDVPFEVYGVLTMKPGAVTWLVENSAPAEVSHTVQSGRISYCAELGRELRAPRASEGSRAVASAMKGGHCGGGGGCQGSGELDPGRGAAYRAGPVEG